MNVTSCCVFSLPPGRDFADAMLFDRHGDLFETTVIDCVDHDVKPGEKPARLSKPAPGDGPVLSCGRDMEWLLSAVSPRLADEHRHWVCLEADGICIGGVLWGAPSGEAQRLSTQVQEISAMAAGWALALRTTQIREEARALSEQLAEANRQLQNAQSELLRSRTVVTVGEMAAGAAHEMNNPLAVISGRSQLLAAQLSDAKHKAMAHLVYEQSQRLSDIISELMDFAKPQPPKPIQVDLAELTNRALHEAKQLSENADTSIEVTFADVPDVMVDPDQLRAALIEVIGNSLQAVEANEAGKAGKIEIHAAFDAFSKRVVMTVSDNGCGMDEMTLKRAFDPFFSSKPAGRRRGMGLAKAMRWVESSGGSIKLESRTAQGTRTMILLPAVQQNVTQAERKTRKAQ
jgi:signal transduction histidine kinase